MDQNAKHVLFVCAGDSARSLIAESVLNVSAKGRFIGYSAGTRAEGPVDPLALEQIERMGYPIRLVKNKSYLQFLRPKAQRMDFIFTVCRQAYWDAPEPWPGNPIVAHWPCDPSMEIAKVEENKRLAFERVVRQIQARIDSFLKLPFDRMSRAELQEAVNIIGQENSD